MRAWPRAVRRILWGLAALLVVAGTTGFVLWRANRHAIAFLKGMAAGEPARTDLPADTEWGGEAKDGWIYLPVAGDDPAPTLVVAAGVTKKGVHDPRVWKLLMALHEAGFSVLCPAIGELVRPGEVADSTPALAAALQDAAASRLPRADGTRVALVGVSVGGAIALKAATETRVPLRALLLVGVPDDVRPLAREWFRRPVAPPGSVGEVWARSDAGIFARHVILRTALPALVPDGDVAGLRAWLDSFGEDATSAKESDVLPATAEGRRFREAALAEDRVSDADLEWVLSAAGGSLDRMSPAAWSQRLSERLRDTHCYLVHGRGDTLVPLSEMDLLGARLARGNPVHVLASDLLTHVDVESPGIAEAWRHVRFVQAFFDAVRGE